ncbi:hypothetical protein CHLNCDRAFT_143775 [Chlorella variabilis]|uniref:General transcription and DNA repair factor IIH subunit TFB5 n=1 Tax=Chlorella variabilis TaxID=554065 RepID=E1ZAE8_CHLVA|nr:hypothetical protein CHLNCDRAFT_143775 [Chlorella variabilis]EFN57049.1 hypothetical protein CHLNCDRAFT_143775 [Chlorella variabilis]|eukprot:XP_005849151.1 hypothetical protein CHLNCDRAFT_143775 [Chlorella variabilis]
MVQATHGVLITGDVVLIEFIRSLNEEQPPKERFIIKDLGEKNLFIKDKKVEFVQKKVAEWQQSLRFEPKKDQQQQQQQ